MYIWFPNEAGDRSSLPYKTVRYFLSSPLLSAHCQLPDDASRFYTGVFLEKVKGEHKRKTTKFNDIFVNAVALARFM